MDWQTGDIEVNGIRIHYTRTGGAKPALVLAHGFADDGLCWAALAHDLAPRYDVVMPDARGHGRSMAPEDSYGPAAMAQDLAGVIRALGLARPLLLGHSMGAITVLTLAAMEPDLPLGIVLEDPPAWWSTTPFSDEEQAQMRDWVAGLEHKTATQIIAEQQAAEPRWAAAELGLWAASKLRLNPLVFRHNRGPAASWQALLRRITCPALLISADPALGGLVAPEHATALQVLIPQLRSVRIADAGHSIRRDQPAAYLALVERTLAGYQAPPS